MSEIPLTFLLTGPPKAGKSWKGATTPPPRLIIDLEGRARFTPVGPDAIPWNGEDDPMKLEKSKSRTHILETNDISVLDTARQWFRSGQIPWKSITVDSVMEWKSIIEQELIPGVYDPEPKQKGKVNNMFEEHLKDIRNLTMVKDGKVRCVVFISGAGRNPFEGGRVYPIIGGRVGDLVPYWMSLVGFQEVTVPKGSTRGTRQLYLEQRIQNDLDVGDGTDRIVPKVGTPVGDDVTVEDLYNALQDEKENS